MGRASTHSMFALCAPLVVLILAAPALADDGFKPLFNGKNLDGWVNVNCAPDTFTVRDGMIVSSGFPTGFLRTDREYENFVLEVEWRHMKEGGNAGVFVWGSPLTVVGQPFARGIEVQVLDGHNTEFYTSHGDVFAIHGATMKPDRPHPAGAMRCLPSEKRCKPAGEWNHYRITCRGGDIELAVNGKVVSGGSKCNPAYGYICLESEGSECHFRNIRIRELPPTERGDFKILYTGVDLAGWKTTPGVARHWQTKDWFLNFDGGQSKGDHLWTEKEYKNFVLVCDWRLSKKPTTRTLSEIDEDDVEKQVEFADAGSSGVFLRGDTTRPILIVSTPEGSGGVAERTDTGDDGALLIRPSVKADNAVGSWNRFYITLQGDRLTVQLNNQTVIEEAQVADLPESGPIGFMDDGAPIQFANIYIHELD